MPKQETDQAVIERPDALLEGAEDPITNMSTIACELFHAFETWNWVGFYRLVDDVAGLEYRIAGSAETRAELVLPGRDRSGAVISVLDIDSLEKNAFDELGKKYLERFIGFLDAGLSRPAVVKG